MRLRAGVASDRGLVRPANEDSFLLRRGLYVVCDGMGGARGGEVASQMACLGLLGLNPATAGQQDLRAAISSSNQAIAQRGAGEAHLMGMGTTLTATLIRDGYLTLAHVGDSRAYILHSDELTQLTEDHSWVGEMVRRGELTPAEAAVHPHRSVITRALGTVGEVDPDLLEIPVVPGDRVVLCSDGLTGMIGDSEIEELLGRDEEPQKIAELLVKAALAGGGEDNVTVIVVEVLPDGEDGEDDMTAERPGAPFGGDQILFGPSDRGAGVSASSHRARRAGAAVRGRLGLSLPSMRPVASRSESDAPAAGSPVADIEAEPVEQLVAELSPASTADAAATPEPESVPQPVALNAAETPAAPAKPRKKKRRLWLFLTLAVVLVLAAAVAGFAVYNSGAYYVGQYDDGTVALYHGLPGKVLGIELSRVVQLSPVDYASLAPHIREQIDAHELISKEDGQEFLQGLVLPQ
ncbi:MAG: Stp1/IreP family PP2C-type Ser/Thr phosphatase [Thermoleophilia bacterium]|nr:Stp1/IreP family PP2C-type Ser/Thr phosphatase [Thermoleophilia bacterium]